MCGIVGSLSNAPVGTEACVTLDRLAHRGPDGKGLWIGEGVVLGHHRLAIHDLSVTGLQPMTTDTGDLVVVVNGTIHNAAELRADAERDGYVFRGTSDSEVLLPLWRGEGRACLERLRGPFALAVWDVRARRLVLARDPLGKKPLFIARTADGVRFASEMAALLAVLPAKTYRPDAARAYLQAGYVPCSETVVEGVSSLPPGTCLIVDEAGEREERYWTPSLDEDEALAGDAATDALETALRGAVSMRSKTDRTLGVLLSGGLDSAAVLAFATEATNGPLPAFTLGFDDDARFDERDAAAVTANILDAAHHTFSFDVDPGPLLREIVTTTGELLADASLLPTALVCRRAREHAVVLLCGDGSDELLLGYRRHAIARAATRWPFPLRRLAASCGRLLPGSRHRDGAAALAERPEAALADLVGLLPRAPWRELVAGAATGDDPLTRSYASYPTLPDGGAYAGWLDLNTYLPGDLLPKIDRASMLSGVEVWSPFLDVRVVELALRIPARTRQGLLRGKAPLRRLLSRRLPPAVLRRKKRGFGVPLARWMQTSRYGPFCREVLGDLNEPFYGVLRSGSALPLLDRVVGGEDRLAPFVHACVVLALFHDAHLRGNES